MVVEGKIKISKEKGASFGLSNPKPETDDRDSTDARNSSDERNTPKVITETEFYSRLYANGYEYGSAFKLVNTVSIDGK